MKKLLALALFSILLNATVQAQFSNCAQVLRLAQSTYEQGRLHELPTLMDECLKKDEAGNGFTKQQRVEAYRYLTLAYIYLEEPEKADEAMLNLLNTDHYFEVNEQVDPAEFVALYNTFRTTPLLGIGIKGGVNATFPTVTKNYYVGNAAAGAGKYGTKVGFQAGIVIEKQLFAGWKNKTLRQITFSPEILYTIRSLTYSNNSVFNSDSSGQSVAKQAVTSLKQTWLDVNPIFQYKFAPKEAGLNPYVGFGPSASFLIDAQNQMTLTRSAGVGTVSGPVVDIKTSYQKIVPSLIAVAGIKYKFGAIKLTAEARVQYGLSNVINTTTRTNSQSVFDYNYQSNNFKQFNAMVNIGFVYPYFKPVKKRHKK